MPLSANTLPSVRPTVLAPVDAMTAFKLTAETVTADGYIGSNAQVQIPQGRVMSLACLDLQVVKVSAGDEFYRFFVCGSNDVNFANGNVEQLAMSEVRAAAAAGVIANVFGASPAIPPVGAAGDILHIPFMNMKNGILYKYARIYLDVGGTAPSVTIGASWLADIEMRM